MNNADLPKVMHGRYFSCDVKTYIVYPYLCKGDNFALQLNLVSIDKQGLPFHSYAREII